VVVVAVFEPGGALGDLIEVGEVVGIDDFALDYGKYLAGLVPPSRERS